MRSEKTILAVDDDASNLAIMGFYFAKAGYRMTPAEDGMIALKMLEDDPDIDAIVLDKSMPNLGGMEVLQKIKADTRFNTMPVVMLTAAATIDDAVQGIAAGVRYYLTKPYSGAMLIEVVKLALQESRNIKTLKDELHDFYCGLELMEEGRFHFRTLEEAASLAHHIAACLPDPEKAEYGLHELMANAVEHGNLGIGFDEKGALLRSGRWKEEVERRLNLPENRGKRACLTFQATEDAVTIRIEDQGVGFDWRRYLDFSPERTDASHGRGIAACRAFSFPGLDYPGCGNEVRCIIPVHRENRSH